MRLARFNIQSAGAARQAVLRRHAVARRRPASSRRPCTRGRIRWPDWPQAIAAVAVVLVPAALMVSTIRFRSFKTINFGWGPSYMPRLRRSRVLDRVHRDRAARHARHPRLQLSAVGVHRDGGHAAAGAAAGGATGSAHRNRRAGAGRARRSRSFRRRARCSASRSPGPRPDPPVLVEKYGSNARAHRLGIHADAGVVDDHRDARPSLAARRDASAGRPPASPARRSRRGSSARARAACGPPDTGGRRRGDVDVELDAVGERRAGTG